MKDKSKVVIDRKVLFELCDAILNCEGYGFFDDSIYEWCCIKWNENFKQKVRNIRNNS